METLGLPWVLVRYSVNAPWGGFSAIHLSADRLGSDIVSFTPDLGSQAQVPPACTLMATLPFSGFSSFIFLVDKYFLMKQHLFNF